MLKILCGSLLGALLAVLAASPVQAATVTLRVSAVGPRSLPRTTVRTPSAPVGKDGHDCAPATPGGALDAAVGHAGWSAHFDPGFHEQVLDAIFAEAHPFGSHVFWAVYVNGRQGSDGLCNVSVADGDRVQFVALCDPFDPPKDGSPCFGEPLALKAPATVAAGRPVRLTVSESRTDLSSGVTAVVPSQGARVAAGGHSARTDAAGHATLRLTRPGRVTVTATKGVRVDDSATLCVTAGAKGGCADHSAPHAAVTSIRDGRHFKRGRGPRRLSGRVGHDASGIGDVRLRIIRNDRGRCATYDAGRGRWRRLKRCGAAHGAWFSIGSQRSWSYRLARRATRGRYVVDVRAVDRAGNADTKLVRGRNRIVFVVG